MRDFVIMCVDDDERVLEGIKRTLKGKNYSVIKMTSAQEAMDYIKDKDGAIDIVISDNKMPYMSGVQFFVTLREQYPDIIRIMLTGQSDLEDAKRAINEGEVYKFLTKPCDADDLRLVVRHACAHKDLWQKNKDLIHAICEQEETIKRLEEKHPGITDITRDASGTICLDNEDLNESLDDFMKKYFS